MTYVTVTEPRSECMPVWHWELAQPPPPPPPHPRRPRRASQAPLPSPTCHRELTPTPTLLCSNLDLSFLGWQMREWEEREESREEGRYQRWCSRQAVVRRDEATPETPSSRATSTRPSTRGSDGTRPSTARTGESRLLLHGSRPMTAGESRPGRAGVPLSRRRTGHGSAGKHGSSFLPNAEEGEANGEEEGEEQRAEDSTEAPPRRLGSEAWMPMPRWKKWPRPSSRIVPESLCSSPSSRVVRCY